MRFTIFSRLIIGYIFIFILVMAVIVYTTYQLRQFSDITHSVLNIYNQTIEMEKKLTDAIISQIRYEKKFIILKDNSLYKQFLISKDDFDKYLTKMMLIVNSIQTNSILNKITKFHQRYQSLFYEEVEFIKSGKHYPQDWYKIEKDKAINVITNGLKKLKDSGQKDTYIKVKKLGEAGAKARKVAIVMTIISFIFGISISIFITRSITKPLSIMKKKIKKIAKGNLESDLNLSSPPEIGELAHAFNFMCSKLKAVDKMKSDFFSVMSHELRTPLSSIKEGTNLLLEGVGGDIREKQKRLLTIIDEESNRLISLVNSILDLSKMESGMMVFNFIQADLVSLINKTTKEIEPIAESNNIKLETKINNKLPLIKMDIEKILQVLRNLLSNAIKFTPNGGLIKITSLPIEQGIKVIIEDTGIGISKENLIAIFDKFHQATFINSNKRNKIKGTGLGLSIVKHIIKAHGGEVWAESTPRQGSTFIFVLPV